MVFRTSSFLLAAVVIVGGVNSAAIGEDGSYGDSEWPAGISPLDSLSYWRIDDGEKASTADNKKACCQPSIWTGRLFVEYRLEQPGRRVTYRYLLVVYFDQANKRLASDIIMGNTTLASHLLLFNKTGATQYTFSKARRWCSKQFLPGAQFRPQCIPANATLLRSFSLGAGSGALKTQTWSYGYSDRRAESSINILVTPGDCVPVISAIRSTSRDSRMRRSRLSIGTLFTDMKTNIADQSVFTPPSFCKKRGGEEEGEEEEKEGDEETAEEGEEEEGEEDEKLYFDHKEFHINPLIESFVAVP